MQQHLFQQIVDTLARFGRHRHEWRFATVFFRHDLLGDQFLRHAVHVTTGFVDLVDRHHQRHAGCFRMGNRFFRLRHHAIVRHAYEFSNHLPELCCVLHPGALPAWQALPRLENEPSWLTNALDRCLQPIAARLAFANPIHPLAS